MTELQIKLRDAGFAEPGVAIEQELLQRLQSQPTDHEKDMFGVARTKAALEGARLAIAEISAALDGANNQHRP